MKFCFIKFFILYIALELTPEDISDLIAWNALRNYRVNIENFLAKSTLTFSC